MDYHEIGMIDLVLAEVLQGAAHEREFQSLRRQLGRFRFLETGGESLAIMSAKNYRTLRERGLTVRKTIDCLIATICITEGYVLLHRDRDFDGFEKHLGLSVIHPRFQ